MFEGKNVVLGVTGSIAVYKAVDIASKLTQKGLTVDVVMTKAAMQFVTPLSFRSVTHRPVVTDMWELSSEFSVEHVALAERAATGQRQEVLDLLQRLVPEYQPATAKARAAS